MGFLHLCRSLIDYIEDKNVIGFIASAERMFKFGGSCAK